MSSVRLDLELPTLHRPAGSAREVAYSLDGLLEARWPEADPQGVAFRIEIQLGCWPLVCQLATSWPLRPEPTHLLRCQPYLKVFAQMTITALDQHLQAACLIATAAGQPLHR